MKTDEKVIQIDANENAIYYITNGHVTKVSGKEFGQDIFYWKDGKVLDVERSQRIRNCGQKIIQ
ncbi:MAG: hypothetical protein ACE3JK_01090 [Sporolactobacillus sp.]